MGKSHNTKTRFGEWIPSASETLIYITAGGSAAMNAVTAYFLIGGWIMPLAAALDLWKPHLPGHIGLDLKNRAFGMALARLMVLLVLVGISSFAAFNTIMTEVGNMSGEADRHAAHWRQADAKAKAAQAKADAITARKSTGIEPLIGPAGVKAATKKEREKIWRRTAGCTDATLQSSIAACLTIKGLRTELDRAVEKEKQLAIATRERAKMEKIGPPVESHPGAAAVGAAFGVSRDDVRAGFFAILGLMVEIAATFGFALNSRSRRKRTKEQEQPTTVQEVLEHRADEDGIVETSYRQIAEALGWYGKGKVPMAAKAKRHVTKLVGEDLVRILESGAGGSRFQVMQVA